MVLITTPNTAGVVGQYTNTASVVGTYTDDNHVTVYPTGANPANCFFASPGMSASS